MFMFSFRFWGRLVSEALEVMLLPFFLKNKNIPTLEEDYTTLENSNQWWEQKVVETYTPEN